MPHQPTKEPMTQINNILVAHDFSSCSAQALDFGVEIAFETGARLHFLHVEVFPEDRFLARPSLKSKEAQLKLNLEAALKQSVKKQGFTLSDIPAIGYAVVEGYAVATAIVQHCEAEDIDLVVLGTHGTRHMAGTSMPAHDSRGVNPGYLGSVAEAVVRLAPCTVLTIREAVQPQQFSVHLKRILVSVDLHDRSVAAIHYAKQVAAYYGARLEVLHIVETWQPMPYYDKQHVVKFDAKTVEEKVRTQLKMMAQEAGSFDVEVDYIVRQGDPADEILRYSQANASGLIMLTANNVAGHWTDGVGSTIERVVRRANCPVMTVKQSVVMNAAPGKSNVGFG